VSSALPAAEAAANPIDEPGTSEATWLRWPGLCELPTLDVTGWASAVIVAAHPDDEVLGPGGIISVLAAAGARLRLIAVTDGEASHPGYGNPAGLARRRAAERVEALRALGAGDTEVVRLGLPDTGLAGREEEMAAALADLAAGFDACLAPWESDVHADHEAVGRALRQAGGRLDGTSWFYPVWAWHWARPADPQVPWHQAVRVPLPVNVAARKRAAISCFGSQLEPRPPSRQPVLTAGFVRHFARDFEILFPVVQQ
jgi:LmbE family N-acetylglucosaminyl deacetylase